MLTVTCSDKTGIYEHRTSDSQNNAVTTTAHVHSKERTMTLTMTINDHLVELGSLVDNKEQSVQRVGARLVDEFFSSDADQQSDEVVVNVLYYLTDIQVRDYTLGILNPADPTPFISGLNRLIEAAPTDTEYMNAPASLLAVMHYELGDTPAAFTTLSNAQNGYSLAMLLYRVFTAGWTPEGFAAMRSELHPKVVEGIFGGDN